MREKEEVHARTSAAVAEAAADEKAAAPIQKNRRWWKLYRSGDPSARSQAGLLSRITFAWAGGLVREANKRELEEGDAAYLMPESDSAHTIASEFEVAYAKIKVFFAWAHSCINCLPGEQCHTSTYVCFTCPARPQRLCMQ